jgi:hypothetical protein
MVGKTVDLLEIITPDQKACEISNLFVDWESRRQPKVAEWKEVQEYIFATDTTKTSNSKLPWSNKTTLPKLCQIRDNLHANYMAAMFPQRKWMAWEGSTPADDNVDKKEAIESYMGWVVDRNQYYNTVSQLVYDYIDYGNCFTMPEWLDMSNKTESMDQVGYVGPAPRRISPLDIVFNPVAPSFEQSPKIIRSMITLGEVKQMLDASSIDEESLETAQNLWKYLKDIRENSQSAIHQSIAVKDRIYNISGFDSYQAYLGSNMAEVLTFYGDIFDYHTEKLQKNVVIKIIDRHKIIYEKPNNSSFGYAPIYHCGWRLRPDNLWASGPLDNLVGMQYRIDHLENMKADVFDLIAYPPLKIKGYVEDFDWAPMERIYVGDDGDIELLSPDVQALQADTEIAILEAKMEEFAGSPKEAMGFRTPGEKTKYEVQSLENAAGRIFQNKITYFERHITENLLNAMLELARRNMTTETIRIFDDEFKINVFTQLSVHDITGLGRIKPIAARHFAEQANMIQNLNNFYSSVAGQDPAVLQHFSSVRTAQVWEALLDIKSWKVVEPFIRLSEQADAQRLANSYTENVNEEMMTPTGMKPGDFDPEELQ